MVEYPDAVKIATLLNELAELLNNGNTGAIRYID